MKNILLFIIAIMPVVLHAQATTPETIYKSKALEEAGTDLVLFANQAQISYAVIAAGIGISLSSQLITYDGTNAKKIKQRDESRKQVVMVGTVVMFAGGIVNFVSYSHARSAGKALKSGSRFRIDATPDGIGLVVPVK